MSSGAVDLGQTFGSGGGGVTSLNSMTGAIALVPGTGISITPGAGTLTIASTVASLVFADSLVNNFGTVTLVNDSAAPGANQYYGTNGGGTRGYYPSSFGTVTSVSVVSANGLSGSVATATTTPAITLAPTFTGITYSTGSAFQTAIAANFPTLNQNTTGTAANVTASSNSTLVTLSALSLPGAQVTGNISGNAANVTATSNSTLTTLTALSLPTSQLSGNINLTSQVTGLLPFGNGGTNASTAAAAFNNLNPMTTTGDIIYEASANVAARLGIGSSGQVLTVIGGIPSWQTVAGTGSVTSVSVVSANGFAGSVATPTSTPAITLSTTVTGILQGNGTAISAASTTGSGNVVLATSPTLVTPNLGTPSTLVGTNITGTASGLTAGNINATSNSTLTTLSALSLPTSQLSGSISLTTQVSGILPVANGGTNLSATPTNGQTLIGNGTGYTLATITAGNGITVTNGAGSITVASNAPYNYTVVAISSNTSAASGTTYLANTSGAPFTVTLPAPSSGAYILIKDVGGTFQTNNLTISPHASEQIEGLAASYLAQTNYGSYTLVTDGTNWWFI